MKTKKHLDEDQILWAITDETRLSDDVRRHLSKCPVCRNQKVEMERDISNLGETARRLCPPPKTRPSLEPFAGRSIRWRSMSAMAVSILLVALVGIWAMPDAPVTDIDGMHTAGVYGWEDEMFMREVAQLSENPFPVGAGLIPVFKDNIEDYYLEFLVPARSENPVSKYPSAGIPHIARSGPEAPTFG
ncbi:MAG: hypothetical protein R6U50_03245 [Desulfobacterales bacterium]